jgi:hypothetical protein
MKTSVNDGCTNIQHSRTEQPVFKAGYVPCNSRFAGPKSIHLHEPAPEIKKAMAGPGAGFHPCSQTRKLFLCHF